MIKTAQNPKLTSAASSLLNFNILAGQAIPWLPLHCKNPFTLAWTDLASTGTLFCRWKFAFKGDWKSTAACDFYTYLMPLASVSPLSSSYNSLLLLETQKEIKCKIQTLSEFKIWAIATENIIPREHKHLVAPPFMLSLLTAVRKLITMKAMCPSL